MANVLIVDDETYILDVLSNIVQSVNHDPIAVSRGDEAIELLSSRPFDLTLTDLRMQPVDGMQVLAAARETCPAMPVIVITAYASPETRTQAESMGAFAYLTKPFHVGELIDTLTRALDDHH